MNEIEPAVRREVEKKLNQIEAEFGVEILLAVESGSRAWGFESTDSDYDVRFIYRHPLKWYLNVLPKRDVIELPISDLFDYSGWDIRKSLFLLNKSNPVLLEWLRSPIVYRKDSELVGTLFEASRQYYSPAASIHHYLHMATGNFRDYLQGSQVKVKKYFYVLRPLLACSWIERMDEPPPMEFERLLNHCEASDSFKSEVRKLLTRKRAGLELGIEPAIPEIGHFITEQIAYFEAKAVHFGSGIRPDPESLNELLWSLVASQ